MEIKYNISQLGLVTAYLFGNAEKCYNFLEEKNYIKKLEEMNQLGVIQNTNIKTSHKRMEYVVLQLFILNLLKGRPLEFNSQNSKDTYNTGLSNKDNIGKFKVSGMDLISIWILLFNSGHLMGTFASEKGLLKYIKANVDIFNIFISNMPDDLKYPFEWTIKNNDLNNLHKFLIIFTLTIHYKQARKSKNKEFIKFLIGSCQKYFLDGDDRTVKLRMYFNKIRQISYLFLDSQYSAFPINFSITPILLNFEEYIGEILSRNSYFNKTIDSLDELLAHNLYYSKESIDEFNFHSNHYYSFLDKSYWTENKLKNEIISNENKHFEKTTKNISIHIFLEFGLFSRFYEKIEEDLEIKLNGMLPENCLVAIEDNYKLNFIVINMIFISGNSYNHLIAVSKFTKELIILKNKFLSEYLPDRAYAGQDNVKQIVYANVNRSFSDSFKEVILFILSNVTENHHFEFEDSYDNIQIFSPINMEHIKLTFESILDETKVKFKKDEKLFIESVSKSLFYSNATMLISLSSIKGYLNSNNDLNVEMDGFVFMYKEQKLHLFILESKNQAKHAYSDAKKDLEIKLEKLNFQYDSKEFINCNNPKGVYCHLMI